MGLSKNNIILYVCSFCQGIFIAVSRTIVGKLEHIQGISGIETKGIGQYYHLSFTHIYVGVYIPETIEKQLRKRLGLCQSLQLSIGIILSHCLGYFYGWRLTSFVMVVITLCSSTLTLFLPETPYWLIEKDRHEEAL